MTTSLQRRREDDDNSSAVSHSSRLSYEVDPYLIIEEISKQADYSSDDESDDESEDEIEQHSNCTKASGDALLDREINTSRNNLLNSSAGSMIRVSSDLSICSELNDKEGQCAPPSGRLPRSRSSVLAMFERQIVDKAVKTGKITRTQSMDISGNSHGSFKRTGSSFAFRRRLSACECINEEVEVGRNQNETFEDTLHHHPLQSQQMFNASTLGRAMLGAPLSQSASKRNILSNQFHQNSLQSKRMSNASTMGRAMLGAPLSQSASQGKVSTATPAKDTSKREIPAFASIMKKFKLDLTNMPMSQKDRKGSKDTLDTADMTSSGLSRVSLDQFSLCTGREL